MAENKLRMDSKRLTMIIVCLAIAVIFWFLPAPEPLTQVGMRVLGVFLCTVILLSTVDTVWPAILGVVGLSLTGVVNLNGAISGSLGNWVIYFILMTFIVTHALNEVGFTGRMVAKFMSQKFVQKSPWTLTFSLAIMGMILGALIDQVPAAAFMLAFNAKVYQALGYDKKDVYPHIANIVTIFAVNIGGAMSPISHALIIIGLGIYEATAGAPITLFTYLVYGLPTGIVLFVIMAIIFRAVAKPDFSKFKDFDIKTVLDKQQPMTLREKVVVWVFFITVALWVLPGVLKMIAPKAGFVVWLNQYSITFWAAIAVIVLGVLCIDGKPIVDVRDVVNHHTNWGILLFISIGTYFGSAICDASTGVNAFMSAKIGPMVANVSPIVVVLIIAFATVLMTNFASNVSTITVMTTLGVTLGIGTGIVNPAAIAMVTSFCGSTAYLMPSSFATVAMLHGDEYSNKADIYKYAIIMMIVTPLVVTFLGYNLGCLL